MILSRFCTPAEALEALHAHAALESLQGTAPQLDRSPRRMGWRMAFDELLEMEQVAREPIWAWAANERLARSTREAWITEHCFVPVRPRRNTVEFRERCILVRKQGSARERCTYAGEAFGCLKRELDSDQEPSPEAIALVWARLLLARKDAQFWLKIDRAHAAAGLIALGGAL